MNRSPNIKLNNPSDLSQEKQYEALIEKGKLLIKQGKISEAITFFESIVTQETENAYFFYECVKAIKSCENDSEVEQLFDAILNGLRKDTYTINYFADILLQQGDTEKAHKAWQQCLKLDLGCIDCLESYINSLLIENKLSLALTVINSSIALLKSKNFDPIRKCAKLISSFIIYQFEDRQLRSVEAILVLFLSHPFSFANKKTILSIFIKSIREVEGKTTLKKFIELWLSFKSPNDKILHSYLHNVFKANKNDQQKFFEVYECWIELEPKNTEAQINYVLGLFVQETQPEKVQEFKNEILSTIKAIEDHLEVQKSINFYANILSKKRDHEKSLFLFEIALNLNNKNNVTINIYAKALLKQEKIEEACQFFEQSLQLDDKDMITLNGYACALLKLGEIKKACQLFEQSLQLDDKQPVTLKVYANALLRIGEIKKAYQLFQQSLQINNKDTNTLNSYANALLQQGEIEKACQLFKESLQLDDKNITTLNNYANALLQKQEIEKACQLFKESLQIKNSKKSTKRIIHIVNEHAKLLLQQGELEKACQLLRYSLQLDDSNRSTLKGYASALLEKGEVEKGYQLFEKLLKVDPKESKSLNSYANALLQQGEVEKASQLFEQSLQLDDKNITTLNNYANALLQKGERERAFQLLELLEQVIKLDYKITTVPYCRSYVHLEYSKHLEAQGYYQKALSQLLIIDLSTQKDYHANIIRLHIGRLYYRLHQEELGKQYFEAVVNDLNGTDKDQSILYAARSLIAVNPHSQDAIDLLQRIDETSLKYEEAIKVIALNADSETAHELFAGKEENFKDHEMLYRSMYHKIGNEVAILKSIAQRLLRKIKGEHPIVKDIVQALDDLQDSVTHERAIEKAKITALSSNNYSQLIQIVSQTAHNISDEVNNILAAIESKTLRVLRKMNDDDLLKEKFEKLLLQLELAQAALNDLKSINEGIAIRCHRFPIKKLFEKWQPKNWSSTPRIHRARIKLKIDNPDSEFDGDEEKIKSIINELIENSLKQNPNHRDLLIRIFARNILNPTDIGMPTIPGSRKYLYIQVIDNGKGIPEDKKEWIFQPLNTTSPEDKGSGLGLFIARKTLQKMDGYIRESGETGKGARFQMYIPYLSNDEF